jgi:hypothetical protein
VFHYIKMVLVRKGRKGQIRMTETIAILFIFFVLVLFGIIFYYKFQQVLFQEKQEELLASRAMDTTLKVLFLPELLCTNGDTEPEDNCIDMAKLRHAETIFTENLNQYYFDIFSYASVTVHQTFPLQIVNGEEQEVVYPLYEKIPDEWERKEPTYFVVTLRDEFSNLPGETHYGYGYVKVEVYS